MNWMTSGRHRALRSKRGKKRSEMHFPAHVQREVARVRRHPLAQSTTSAARDADEDAPAWYIRPIMDANESHDIQMLELARKVATGTPARGETTTRAAASPRVETNTAATLTSPNNSARKEEPSVQERRCVFTPVKANRSRSRGVSQRPVKRTASPQPPGLLLFNEGEQVSKSGPAESAPKWTSKLDMQEPYSATTSTRWSSHPKGDHDSHAQNCWDSQKQAPFYASSSSSTDEDALEAGNQTSAPANAHGQRFVSHMRSNMFDELDRAMKTKPPLLSQEDLSAHDTHHTVNVGDRTHPPYFQRSETPQLARMESVANVFIAQSESIPVPNSYSGRDSAFRESQMTSEQAAAVSLHALSRRDSIRGRREVAGERSPTGHPSGLDEEDRESTSSQGSFVLPPPVNWQKDIISRHNEMSLEERPSVDQDQSIGPSTRGDGSGPLSFLKSTRAGRNQDYGLNGNGWKCTPRTRAILARIELASSHQTQEKKNSQEAITRLQRRLREKDAMVSYVHTLLQCHRIDEAVRSSQPLPS